MISIGGLPGICRISASCFMSAQILEITTQPNMVTGCHSLDWTAQLSGPLLNASLPRPRLNPATPAIAGAR